MFSLFTWYLTQCVVPFYWDCDTLPEAKKACFMSLNLWHHFVRKIECCWKCPIVNNIVESVDFVMIARNKFIIFFRVGKFSKPQMKFLSLLILIFTFCICLWCFAIEKKILFRCCISERIPVNFKLLKLLRYSKFSLTYKNTHKLRNF